MTLRDLHYDSPWAANLAFFVFLLAFLLWDLYRYRERTLRDASLLFTRRSRLCYGAQSILLIVSWLAAVAALMGPLANGHYPEGRQPKRADAKLRRPAHEVVLMVDTSASMEVADMHNGQSRLAYARQLADEFVSMLDGEQVSLYAFTSDISPLSPPTLDYLFVRMMLGSLRVNETGIAGTDFRKVLEELYKRLERTPVTTLKTIVLFTDGGDTAIETASPVERSAAESALMKSIGSLLKLNARLYTVEMGSVAGGIVPGVTFQGKPVTSKVNKMLLEAMAQTGHGKMTDSSNYTVIDAARLLADEVNNLSTGAQGQEISRSVALGDEQLLYDHYFQVPLALAIAALLAALYVPQVRLGGSFIAVVALFACPLNSQEVRSAVVLAEAGEYDKAEGVLEKLAQAKLEAWQQQALQYDKGTLYLSQKEWDQALSIYTSIPLDGLPPPLESNLKTNQGIAYLEKARALRAMEPTPFPVIYAQEEDALTAFRQAGATAMPNPDSGELQRIAAVERAEATGENLRQLLTHPSLREGLPLLLLNLVHLKDALRFLDRDWVDVNSREQYLQLIGREQEVWSLLWNALLFRWTEGKEGQKQGEALFVEAEGMYAQGVDLMRKTRWEESRQALVASSDKLIGALRLVFGNNPQQDLLQRLLSTYRRTLGQDTLSVGALVYLRKEQEALMEVAKTDQMARSLEILKAAVAALQQGKTAAARLNVEIAQEIVRRQLDDMQAKTSKSLLEELIAEQTFAGTVLYMHASMEVGSGVSGTPWRNAQEDVMRTAASFLPAVFEEQTTGFQQEHLCQAHPWGEVLPLFEKGRHEAMAALKELKEGGELKALSHEARALIAWQQALALLNKPVENPNAPCSTGAAPQEEPEKGEQAPPQPQPIDDVLRVLQQLNLEDKLPSKEEKVEQEELRPW